MGKVSRFEHKRSDPIFMPRRRHRLTTAPGVSLPTGCRGYSEFTGLAKTRARSSTGQSNTCRTGGDAGFKPQPRHEAPADRSQEVTRAQNYPSTRTERMVATDHATGPHIKGGEQCMTSHTPKYHQAAYTTPPATHATTTPSHSTL